jgi:hypothetical protein
MCLKILWIWSVAKAEYRHCQNPRCCPQLLRKDGSQSAVALGVGLASLTHRGWHPSSTAVGDPQLRQSYITPHLESAVQSFRQSFTWCPAPLRALTGFQNRRYVKLPALVRACQPPALPSRFASYVRSSVALLVCRRCGICQALCAWFYSAASPCILCWPPPTLRARLLRSIACAVCPSAPQGGSLRTARLLGWLLL